MNKKCFVKIKLDASHRPGPIWQKTQKKIQNDRNHLIFFSNDSAYPVEGETEECHTFHLRTN